jgi:hypothetical protein
MLKWFPRWTACEAGRKAARVWHEVMTGPNSINRFRFFFFLVDKLVDSLEKIFEPLPL